MAMVFHKQPSDPWEHGDFKLLEAYQILQDETCGSCGQPIWLCDYDNDSAKEGSPVIGWEVNRRICRASAAIEKHRGSDNYHAKPGESLYATPFTYVFNEDSVNKDYEKLPTRNDYLRSLKKT